VTGDSKEEPEGIAKHGHPRTVGSKACVGILSDSVFVHSKGGSPDIPQSLPGRAEC